MARPRASDAPVAVVGGGVAGMIQALMIARAGAKAVLIERAPELGGLFTSSRTPYGPIDRGIHILYETGIAEIDALVRQQLPDNEWITLSGVRKDVAGNFFRGKLNEGAMFPDLRLLPAGEQQAAREEILAMAGCPVPGFGDCASLQAFFERRFGAVPARDVFAPIARKVWKYEPAAVSPWAARIVHMTRVVLDDDARSLELKSDPALDQLIGFPDQLRLPTEKLSGRLDALYPAKFGLSHFVEALSASLRAANVELATEVQVDGLTQSGGGGLRVGLKPLKGEHRDLEASAVVWTSPIEPLGALLGASLRRPPDPFPASQTVFLFLAEAPRMGELYYFYCFDPEFAAFRVSNYAAFCPSAAGAHGYPVSVELHFAPGAKPPEDVEQRAIEEALRLGVVASRDAVRHVYRHPPGGFFVPTLANMAAVAESHAAVEARAPANLFVTAPNASTGAFYLQDNLAAADARLRGILYG